MEYCELRWCSRSVKATSSAVYCLFSRTSNQNMMGPAMTTTQAPSENFTTANTNAISRDTVAEAAFTATPMRQPLPFSVRCFLVMPAPAMVKAVNTPMA